MFSKLLYLTTIYIYLLNASHAADVTGENTQSDFKVQVNISSAVVIEIEELSISDQSIDQKVEKTISTNIPQELLDDGGLICFISGTDYNPTTQLLTVTNTKEPYDSFILTLAINHNCSNIKITGKPPKTAIPGSMYALTEQNLIFGATYN